MTVPADEPTGREVFAMAICRGETVHDAAVLAGTTERNGYRWLKSADVVALIDELRSAALTRGISRLMDETVLAVDTLADLCHSARSEHARVMAASRILEAVASFATVATFERRLSELEGSDPPPTDDGEHADLPGRLATVLELPPRPDEAAS